MNNGMESMLCKQLQQDYCHPTGNATTGLYLALMALELKGRRIAIPNSVCPNVPLAVLLSGNIPVYLDISTHDLGIDVRELKALEEGVDAVIAVHAYGAVCSIQAISDYCDSQGIPLIEDIAVAQGASVDGRPVGGFSNISVLSFGAGKIINAGHGGAIMTNQFSIFERIVSFGEGLGFQDESDKNAVDAFGHYHTALYNEHYGSLIENQCATFKARALKLRKHILCRFDGSYEPSIIFQLENLSENLCSRQAKVENLNKIFSQYESAGIEIFHPPQGSVYWRFNVFIERRDELLKLLLMKKYLVSSWFPSVDQFFEDRQLSKVNTKVSDSVGDHILNLWINDEADSEYIEAVGNELVHYITAGLNKAPNFVDTKHI